MKIIALMKRIIQQFMHDKRSLALLFIAPILVLTLLWVVLDIEDYEPIIATTNLPSVLSEELKVQDVIVLETNQTDAKDLISKNEVDAWVFAEDKRIKVTLEGSNPTAAKMVQQMLSKASANLQASPFQIETNYLHGSDSLGTFDQSGPALIGLFVFFFVFILSGVTFLRERTQGTLERLLATPLKRSDIVIGYLGGFGVFILIQSLIIVFYTIYVLGMYMEGSIFSVLVITCLLAFMAQSLGTLLSAYAKNEFQMIQFIPIVIVPQVFFSGIFQTEQVTWIDYLSKIMPLSYGSDALKEVMLRGAVLNDVWIDLIVMLGFFFLFLILNIIALKKYRAT